MSSNASPDTRHFAKDSPAARCLALLDRLEIVTDDAGEAALLDQILKAEAPLSVGFVNAHAMNLVAANSDIAQAFVGLDVLLRDGKGMEILLNKLDRKPGKNMNGTDFIPRLLSASRGRRLAVFGTREPWLSDAAKKIAASGGNVIVMRDGFQPDAAYLSGMESAVPEIILLGMGMPRQEQLSVALAEHARRLKIAPVMICGGAILDFYAERHGRAPAYWRRNGLEWLWRLGAEPRRLAKRYLVGNPQFLMRIGKIKALDRNRQA